MHRESTPFVKIPLTQGKVALVSPEDAAYVLTLKWSVRRVGGRLYAQAYVRGTGRAGRNLVLLHRFIARTPPGLETDHANGNGLDNRRGNLRDATVGQNRANSRRKLGESGYRGVKRHGRGWSVELTNGNGGRIYLGTFDTPEVAARAFDDAARRVHGAFARLNFPRPGERGL